MLPVTWPEWWHCCGSGAQIGNSYCDIQLVITWIKLNFNSWLYCALLLQHSTKTADLLWWMTNDRGQLNCLVVACLQSPVSAGTWFISSWNSARRPPIELSTGFRGISLRQEKVPIAYRAFSFFKTTTSFNNKASICLLMYYAPRRRS